MQLSKNFWLKEFLWSDKAARMGRVVEAPPPIIENLQRLCTEVLQPIRDALCAHYGKDMPIDVSSGYRPKWLNTAVGGSPTSDHLRGNAADIGCPHISDYELTRFIAGIINKLPVKDLGFEFQSWVHVARQSDGKSPEREIWTAKKAILGGGRSKTVYLNGVVLLKGESK